MSKLTIKLWNDPDAENPCDNDGWKLYSFSSRHCSCKHPNEFFPPNVGLRRKLAAGTAFILSYFEHGQCMWMLQDSPEWERRPDKRWDGTRTAGILIWEQPVKNLGPKTLEDRRKDAAGFCKTYTSYCNNENWGYTITDEDGEHVDSCGGFLGDPEYMFTQIQECTKDVDLDDITIEGDAKWLADYHSVKAKEKEIVTV